MSKRQDALAIVVGNGAKTGDAHIAGNQYTGDNSSRLERIFPPVGGLGGVNRASRPALHGRHSQLLEQRTELAQDVVVKSGKGEWRFNRRKKRRLANQIRRSAGRNSLRQ